MNKLPLVSIIIVTHNRLDKLKILLESLVSDNYPKKEIIVVDNASTDNTPDIIKKYCEKFPYIFYVKNDKNYFPAKGRNIGAKYAKGKYLFFIDDDGAVDKDTINKLVEVLESDEKVGLVAPVILYWNSDIIWCAGGYNDLFTSLTKYLHRNKKLSEVNLPKQPYEIDHMPHTFMVRKECFDKLGGFYEKYKIMYEESELAIRIKKLGYKVLAVPSAIAYHNIPIETDNSRNLGLHRWDRVYLLARNRVIFMKRNAPKTHYIIFLLTFNLVITMYYLYVLLKLGKTEFIGAYLKGVLEGMVE
ncbi:glycosyltransferase family 2 protein [Methanocaldococcus indicus]|uniref:glycosyltransferase family 2 protein n=1 Tax=Methanocaldococcus indicus TaxID=213231 RepID=UPI003C6D5CFE